MYLLLFFIAVLLLTAMREGWGNLSRARYLAWLALLIVALLLNATTGSEA